MTSLPFDVLKIQPSLELPWRFDLLVALQVLGMYARGEMRDVYWRPMTRFDPAASSTFYIHISEFYRKMSFLPWKGSEGCYTQRRKCAFVFCGGFTFRYFCLNVTNRKVFGGGAGFQVVSRVGFELCGG